MYTYQMVLTYLVGRMTMNLSYSCAHRISYSHPLPLSQWNSAISEEAKQQKRCIDSTKCRVFFLTKSWSESVSKTELCQFPQVCHSGQSPLSPSLISVDIFTTMCASGCVGWVSYALILTGWVTTQHRSELWKSLCRFSIGCPTTGECPSRH